MLVDRNFFLSLCHVDVSNGLVAVKDTSDLLEGGALSLDEDEVDPDSFQHIPALRRKVLLEDTRSRSRRGVRGLKAYCVEDPEIISLG